jgi:ribonuclease HI
MDRDQVQAQEDQEDRACGMEVVYIRAVKFGPRVRCTWWFQNKDPRNKAVLLPGKVQTANRGLLFALREVLKKFRKTAHTQYHDERLPLLFVRTDATYIQEGMDTYIYTWRRNEWCNKRGRKIANYVFWQSVNNEMESLEELGTSVRVQRCKLPRKCINV